MSNKVKISYQPSQLNAAVEFIHNNNNLISYNKSQIYGRLLADCIRVAKELRETREDYTISTMGYTIRGFFEGDYYATIEILVDPAIANEADFTKFKVKTLEKELIV
jgi:hypothetical protein